MTLKELQDQYRNYLVAQDLRKNLAMSCDRIVSDRVCSDAEWLIMSDDERIRRLHEAQESVQFWIQKTREHRSNKDVPEGSQDVAW